MPRSSSLFKALSTFWGFGFHSELVGIEVAVFSEFSPASRVCARQTLQLLCSRSCDDAIRQVAIQRMLLLEFIDLHATSTFQGNFYIPSHSLCQVSQASMACLGSPAALMGPLHSVL